MLKYGSRIVHKNMKGFPGVNPQPPIIPFRADFKALSRLSINSFITLIVKEGYVKIHLSSVHIYIKRIPVTPHRKLLARGSVGHTRVIAQPVTVLRALRKPLAPYYIFGIPGIGIVVV